MKFIVLGQQSAITYKSVFPLLRDRRVRLGAGPRGQIAWFESPYDDVAAASGHKPGMIRVSGVRWFTNLRHDVRRSLPPLRTMAENLAINKRLRKHLLEKYGRLEYPRYDNYAAIEVPFVDAIPSDYDGVMGVPVTFLDKWDPDGGVAIEDANEHRTSGTVPRKPHGLVKDKEAAVDGRATYCRLLIQPQHELVGARKGVDGADLRVGADTPYYRLLIRPAGA